MTNPVLIKNGVASGAVPARSIVKYGASDHLVAAAAAATDKLLGVSTDIAAADGERCDYITAGMADVVYGGNVTRGDLLTADSSGRAVTAAPAAGVNNRIIGVAQVSGVVGDVGAVFISQSMLQGA